MPIITVQNHGPLVTASDYWGSEMEARGLFFLTPNAGCVRLLVPRSLRHAVEEMRTGRHVVLSRGSWPEQGQADALELLFDDGSDSPFALHLTPASCALLPGEPGPGEQWTFAAYDLKRGRPHRCLERICFWRRVPSLPWLKPWEARP